MTPPAAALTPHAEIAISVQAAPQVPDAEVTLRAQLAPRARQCYERTLLTAPTQAGEFVVVITLGASGDVASVSADPATPRGLSPVTVSCVLAAARRVTFTVAGDATGTTLRAKLSFQRAG